MRFIPLRVLPMIVALAMLAGINHVGASRVADTAALDRPAKTNLSTFSPYAKEHNGRAAKARRN